MFLTSLASAGNATVNVAIATSTLNKAEPDRKCMSIELLMWLLVPENQNAAIAFFATGRSASRSLAVPACPVMSIN